jgi:hypothetical protein
MELITSGQMIQFPTVMILLVIIVALAIPKTIGENTVSTLLGGIAGYVSSQGIGRAVAREGERRAGVGSGGATLPSAAGPSSVSSITTGSTGEGTGSGAAISPSPTKAN